MTEILAIDDDREILAVIKKALLREGYQVTALEDPLQLEEDKLGRYQLILLDVMMPGMDGFELLQEIRAVSKVPVLMLTAKGEAEDRFSGFELGADDYLIKPFLPKELLLRVQAILKRAYPESNRIVFLDAVSVDLDKAEVHRDGEIIPLTAKEYSIFTKLAENAGHIVTIGALCQTACGEIWQGYETTLMTHIRHLREKIEKNPSTPVSLITVKRLGYKLIVKGVK